MREQLIKRLGELRISPGVEDEGLLKSMLKGAKRRLLAQTGQYELPNALKPVMLDMAAGEYLQFLQSVGRLDGFDQEYAIRQISQGDTSITYAIGAEGKPSTDTLIETLMNPPEAVIAQWRRVRW